MFYVNFIHEELGYKNNKFHPNYTEEEIKDGKYDSVQYTFSTEYDRDKFMEFLYNNAEHNDDGSFKNRMHILRAVVKYPFY